MAPGQRRISKGSPPFAKRQYLWWIESAKREETRKKRIAETVKLVAQNKKTGEIGADYAEIGRIRKR